MSVLGTSTPRVLRHLLSPAEFRSLIENDAERWAQVIKEQGITAE